MTKKFIIFIGLTLLLAIPVRAQDVTGAMLGYINAERAANGAPPLAYNSQLALAAQNHSNDMAQNNFLSHPGSDGSSIASRMRVAGYNPADFAENIAVQDSNDVFRAYQQWFGSEGHRNNMVSLRFTDVGVAMAVSETGDYYFTMVLGTATPALEDLIFVPTEEVVQATEEVVQVTEEIVQVTEEVVQATEEVVQATEEVVQADVETPSEPSMERAFSATFTADPHPNTQVILSTGPFQPNPFTVIHFEVSYDGVVIATIEASPDVDGVARAPFIGTDQIGTYSVQAFLTSLTVTNQLISSGQFTVREEATEEVEAENGAIENEDQPLTSAFDGLNLQLALPDPALTGSVVGMTMGTFPIDNIPYVQFIISYEGQAIAQIIGDVDDTGIATAEFSDTTVAGNYAVQVLYSDNIRETERSIFYPFVIVPEEIPQDTGPENDAPVVNEPQTGTFRSLDISAPFFDLVNAIRIEAGVRPLGYDGRLLSAAQQHNDDMLINGNFSHTGSDGSDVSQRVEQYNYQWGTVAENILVRSNLSVQGAFEQWLNSPGHRANMLNGDNVHMAVAYGQADDGSYYFTMVLGRPIDYVAPVAPVAPPEIAETVVGTEEALPPTEEVAVETNAEPTEPTQEETVDNSPAINATFVNDQLVLSFSNIPSTTILVDIFCDGNIIQDTMSLDQGRDTSDFTWILHSASIFRNQGCELEITMAFSPEQEVIIVRTNVTVPILDYIPDGVATIDVFGERDSSRVNNFYATWVLAGDIVTINANHLLPNEIYTIRYGVVLNYQLEERASDVEVRADNNGEISLAQTITDFSLFMPEEEPQAGTIRFTVLDSTEREVASAWILVMAQEILDQQTETVDTVVIPEIAMNLTLDNDTGEIQAQVNFLDETRNGEALVATISCAGEALGEVQLVQQSASETFIASPRFVFADNVGCELEVSVAYTTERDNTLASATAIVEPLTFTPYIGLAYAELAESIVMRGDILEMTIRDLAPNETISMVLESGDDPNTATRFNLESVTADENGVANWSVTIPQAVLDGTLLVLGSNRIGVIINEQVLVEPSPEDVVTEDDDIPDGNNLTLQVQLNNLTGRIQVSVLGFAPDDEDDAEIIISVICGGQVVRQYAGMKDNGEIDIEELYDWSLFEDYAGCQATFTVTYVEAPDVVIAQTDALINQPNFMQGTHITVEPQVVVAGETITVTVTDRLGNMSRIAVSYILNEIYGENVESDENGNFVWTTTIPEDFTAGDYNIIALDDTSEFLFGANFTIIAPAINVVEAPQAEAGEVPEVDLNLGITNNVELTLSPNRVTRGEFVDLVASNLTPGQLVSSQLFFGAEVVSDSPPAPVDIDGFLRQHAEMLETDPLGEYVVILLDENELPIAIGSFQLVADEVVQTDETGNTNANTEVGNTEGANTNTGNTGNVELPQPVAAIRNNTTQDAQEVEGVNVIVVTQPPRVDVIPTQAPANQFVMPIAPIDPSLPPPDIELHWNASSFTLFNISNRTLDISELAFTSELGNLNIDRWDVDGLSSPLEVFENGGCLQAFLLSQSSLPEAPEFCQQRHGWLLVGEQNQFWNPLREFTVVLGQNQIAVCTISPCRIRLADDLVDDMPPLPESAPLTTGANVRLTYDETSFLIQNIADTPVILSGIVFQSDTVTFPISEWETEFMRADFFAFPSQDCLQTWDNNIFELPVPESCNFRQGWITVNQNEQFWLNTPEFEVFQFGELIATCSVSAGVCDIEVDQ
ncbi:MAG: hypothetical protein Phog2KO_37160 [Phototrophicaceae bacterium]